MKNINIIIFGIYFLASCASTNVTSFKDREYAKSNYTKIAVLSGASDLEGRKKLERAFVVSLGEQGVLAVSLIDLIPPTRNVTKDELKQVLLGQGCDCLLMIQLIDAYTENVSMPGYASTVWGRGGSFTTYSGGGTVSKPRAKFKIDLIDSNSEKTVWTSSTFTAGNTFAGVDTVVNSLAASTVNKLKEDGLLISKVPSKEINEKKEE